MEDDVRTVVPNVPVWAVYYKESDDSLEAVPVLWFESRRGDIGDRFKPVSFDPGAWFGMDSENFIGLSLTPTPDRREYEAQVVAYRRRMAAKDKKIAAAVAEGISK